MTILLATKVIVNKGDSHGRRRTTSFKSFYKVRLKRIDNSNKRLSSANEMHFSIRQRVVPHRHDSNESTTRTCVSQHIACWTSMRCISPLDNGLYHMGTIPTNRTNPQLGQASLSIQRVEHILSPASEIHFSIRQRVVSHGHDSYESTTRTSVSLDLSAYSVLDINEMHFSTR